MSRSFQTYQTFPDSTVSGPIGPGTASEFGGYASSTPESDASGEESKSRLRSGLGEESIDELFDNNKLEDWLAVSREIDRRGVFCKRFTMI